MTKIIQSDIVSEYKNDLTRYAVFVNCIRAVPNFKDGLKTVHRRIIDTMFTHRKVISHTVKSNSIVGATMEISHPHGDAAVYDSIKGMTNFFDINYPLIDHQGSFGNVQGDGPAASRYTEIKLSKFALDCIIGEMQNSKEIVDYVPTYDNLHMEPEYFPVKIPNLLVNGSFGIAIGLKIYIPNHNLNEVIDATLKLLKNPDAEIVLIPDQLLGADIIDTNWRKLSNAGRGRYRARGKIDIEDKNGKQYLIIRSTPDMTTLNTILNGKDDDKEKKRSIDGLIMRKAIQVVDYHDLTKTDGKINVVLELKKGADPYYTRDVIYAETDMEKSYTVNFEALDGIAPVRFSYKSYLLSFIEFRKTTKFRLYCNQLQKVETKLHEKEAYIKVLESGYIDTIISMIRKQKTIDDNSLIEFLIKRLNITDLQAGFIIKANIRNLSLGYLKKYKEEAEELSNLIKFYMDKILNEDKLVQEIEDELKEIKKVYGRPRRSNVITIGEQSTVPKGDFNIIITENNFIKKIPAGTNMGNFRNDIPKIIIKVCNTKSILLFDAIGKVYKIPVYKIPTTESNSNGIDVRFLIKNLTSDIISVISEGIFEDLSKRADKYFLTVLTDEGYIKKMDLDDFLNVPKSGIICVKLDGSDRLKSVMIVHNALDIMTYSRNKGLRFSLKEVSHQKRNTKGTKSMSSSENLCGMVVIDPRAVSVLVITNNGYVNKFDITGLKLGKRSQAGSSLIKMGKDDRIKAIIPILPNKDNVKIITKNEIINLDANPIPVGSSISAGKKLISTKGDNIVSVFY